MGDRLLIAFIVAVVAFLLGLATGYGDLAEALRHFPDPTESWVALIPGLAWPAIVAGLAVRSAPQLLAIANNFAHRTANDDLDILGVKVSRSYQSSAQADGAASLELLSLVQEDAKKARLNAWIAANVPGQPDAGRFATD